MLDRRRVLKAAAGALGAATAVCRPAHAQGPRGVDLLIGYTPGGSYDLYSRLVARHLARFLPGEPTGVPQNMPGAGSLRAANVLYAKSVFGR